MNNCSATISKIERLLESEIFDTDMRCTDPMIMSQKSYNMKEDSSLLVYIRVLHNWEQAAVMLEAFEEGT